MDTAQIVKTAHEMADAARKAALPFFRSDGLIAENKDGTGFDPVTEADKAVERAMRDVLAEHRPHDGIYGEEYGRKTGKSGLTWVLDPIDGTRAFLAGVPCWGVLIAVSDETGPIYGIIDQPYIGERFEGGFGISKMIEPRGARKLACRGDRALEESILFTTFPEVGNQIEREAFLAVSEHVKMTRYGIDCYAYALVASGQVDLVIEAGLNSYDIQAPIAVIQAAGGFVTDWAGDSACQGGQVIAAAGKRQHEASLEILSRFL
ncbi:MAG: inositol monophosphatase family protein [Roseovarius sp.]|nr:inositol monophosphatase family protein [Roseovarius sp.]